MALKSARISGLEVDATPLDAARLWTRGTLASPAPDEGSVRTARAFTALLLLDPEAQPERASAAGILLASSRPWDPRTSDIEHVYFGTLGMFQHAGPRGPEWKQWNEDVQTLTKHQQKDGCLEGSWDPD